MNAPGSETPVKKPMMKPPSVRITHRVDNPVLIMPKEGTARLSRGDAGLESAVDCAISSPSLPASSCPDCHARHQHQKQPWNENCKQARECNLLPLPVRVNGNLRATGTAKNCAAFLGRWRGRGRRRATCIKLHSVTHIPSSFRCTALTRKPRFYLL